MNLTFQQLREANLKRLPVFKNSKGEPAHSTPDGSDWAPEQWFQAAIGEIGEYANFRKKFERGDIDEAAFKREAAKELADVQIYLDITAYQCGIDSTSELQDFEGLRATVKSTVPIDQATPALLLCSLMTELAQLMEETSTDNLVRVLIALLALAEKLEIDLAEATREKFNAVSDRIGCEVYL